MKTSPVTNEISAALAKAQGSINNPGKDAKNPHFNSRYADLSAGISAIREGLSANGIAFIQTPRIEGDLMMLDTRLTHSSDQFVECEWPVCKLPAPPQQMGSALTYARRYSLFSIVGIAGEDDDGNAANAMSVPSTPAKQQFISDVQAKEIGDMVKACGPGTWERFSADMKVDRLTAIPEHKYEGALSWLNGRLQAGAKNSRPVVPPNPNKPAPTPPQAQQTTWIDFVKFRAALQAAVSLDEANTIYDREVTNRTPPLHPDEVDEAEAILRESCGRFWDNAEDVAS